MPGSASPAWRWTRSAKRNGTAKVKLKIQFLVAGERKPLKGKLILKAAGEVSETL